MSIFLSNRADAFSTVMRSMPGVGYAVERGQIIAQDNNYRLMHGVIYFFKSVPITVRDTFSKKKPLMVASGAFLLRRAAHATRMA
jgi:hypothetical protein